MRDLLIIYSMLLSFCGHAQNDQQMLSPTEMRHDLEVLHDSWVSLHPGLYRFNTKYQIDSLFQEAFKFCSHPQSERIFYLKISKITCQIKCGHTYPNPLNLDSATASQVLPKKVIPLFYKIIGRRFYITHNVSERKDIEPGDEILSFNGVNAQRLIDSLLLVSRGDGNNSLGKRINNMNESFSEGNSFSLFDIYFPLLFPSNDSAVEITLLKFNSGKKIIVTVLLETYEQRKNISEKRFGKIPTYEKTWDYKILNRTAYMKFGTFAFWNSSFNTKKYIDSIFKDLYARSDVRKLIIDIRGNEGGDNSGNTILSYITQKAIGCDIGNRICYRYLSIPDTLLPFLSTWDNSFKKSKDPNQYFINEIGLYESKMDNKCEHILPAQPRFNGKCILLTDAANSSAGFEMARNFKMAHLGTIVGETTGGCLQGINGGAFFFLKLPASNIEVDLPLIYNYHTNQPDRGIQPDIDIQLSPSDLHNNIDGVLNYCIRSL